MAEVPEVLARMYTSTRTDDIPVHLSHSTTRLAVTPIVHQRQQSAVVIS